MRRPVEALMEQYGSNLYIAAFNICGNAQDAEDAVQDTFLQYWRLNKDYETEQHLRAWLFRVTVNRAKNLRKRFFRRNTVPLEEYMAALTFPGKEVSDLFQTVMKLPEKQRTVIHLFYYEDCSVKEIAHILGITPGNVRVRLNRGRAELRSKLKEVWEDDQS